MLYWHFRNIQCILLSFFSPRGTSLTQPLSRTFIANPYDSDWFQVVQAGRFFTYTDAVRWELGFRTGFLQAAIKSRWVIIMGGQKIIHRRPIRIFRRFRITYQIAGWDDHWFYAAHVFRQGGDVKAVSFSKVGLRKNGKLLSPETAFAEFGRTEAAPPPTWVYRHFETDRETLEEAARMLPESIV